MNRFIYRAKYTTKKLVMQLKKKLIIKMHDKYTFSALC